jgi:hypothetical protein
VTLDLAVRWRSNDQKPVIENSITGLTCCFVRSPERIRAAVTALRECMPAFERKFRRRASWASAAAVGSPRSNMDSLPGTLNSNACSPQRDPLGMHLMSRYVPRATAARAWLEWQ